MGFMDSLLGRKQKNSVDKKQARSYTRRLGKSVPVDDVFRAWTSGDLNQMLKAVSIKTNRIDRHHLLQSIVSATYKLRKEDKCRELCLEYSEMHLQEFPALASALKKQMDGILPRISTFQHYVTILTENGEYDRAISVCEKAIKYGLHDGTQAGFEGRIARIRKKAEKEKS